MTEYRIYRLDESGRIAGPGEDVVFSCDTEAWHHAQLMAELCNSLELWQGNRCLGVLSGAPRPPDGPAMFWAKAGLAIARSVVSRLACRATERTELRITPRCPPKPLSAESGAEKSTDRRLIQRARKCGADMDRLFADSVDRLVESQRLLRRDLPPAEPAPSASPEA